MFTAIRLWSTDLPVQLGLCLKVSPETSNALVLDLIFHLIMAPQITSSNSSCIPVFINLRRYPLDIDIILEISSSSMDHYFITISAPSSKLINSFSCHQIYQHPRLHHRISIPSTIGQNAKLLNPCHLRLSPAHPPLL